MSDATDVGVGLAGGAVLVGATQAAGLSPWGFAPKPDAAHKPDALPLNPSGDPP